MQPATGEGLCYTLKRNDNGNTDVDGGPRGRSDWWRGHEEQGAVWTGGVRRVQSKCWPDTWERLKGNQKGNIKCYARERANTKQPF